MITIHNILQRLALALIVAGIILSVLDIGMGSGPIFLFFGFIFGFVSLIISNHVPKNSNPNLQKNTEKYLIIAMGICFILGIALIYAMAG